MNVAFRFYALLYLVSMKADGLVVQPQTLPADSIQPQIQRNESKSDAATDFLDELAAAISKRYPTNDQSNFAAFIDALLDLSEEEEGDDDVGHVFTPFPELISMNADTNASSTYGNVTGSASGKLEITNGDDVNMRDGENVSNNAVVRLLSGIAVSIIVLQAFTLTI
ncbi:unnamed protein product [Peronospora farinosa]|uniref:Uncharacterized protein n=1 Tax=Peronospora farinosa TaxID=134698 RepID=A0AAV0TXJ1_9STRA|nr:unnamed protein product [Peronospora farinosa]CAI5727823.1 unnamed protein product [Peronospora farinosa]